MKEQKEIMNVSELAEYIGVSRSKIYKMIRDKKVPASKIGRQYKFSKQVVDSWLKENIITLSTTFPLFQQKKNLIKGGEKNGKEESQEKGSEEKSS
ncbi:MAG: helix-turn-helix domain-containing protein [bacterium]